MDRPIGDILWTPTPARVEGARVTAFRKAVNRAHDGDLRRYEDLHAWSLEAPEDFWRTMWEFGGVVGDGPGSRILVDGHRMPGAVWFPDARLNFAENLLYPVGLSGPDTRPALIYRDEIDERREISWHQLRADTAAMAAALADAGVRQGDRVVGLMPNLPETIIAMLATASLGAVWSSCSPDFGIQGVLDRFGQVRPRVLVVADGYRYGGKMFESLTTARKLQDQIPTLETTIVVANLEPGGRPAATVPGALDWMDVLGRHRGAEPRFVKLPFDHPLFIMFSSGTTGLPKCMVHSAGGTLLQHLKEHQLHCDLGPGERIFYYTTCGWMMWNWLVSGLATGATVMLYDGHPLRPEPVLWDYTAAEGVHVLGTSARWIAACQKAGLKPGRTHDLSKLRAVLSTGSALSPQSFDYVYRDVKADLQLSSISGGTDIISCFALGSPVLPVRRGELQCRGLGMAVGVFDPEGRSVRCVKGELVCTAPFPSMPVSFWNDPDGSRYHGAYFDRFEGIWCHGDFAEITESGGMVIHGRSDTVLNPGGVRIGTAEIYRVVEKFPEVRESLVVGLDRTDDVRIVLFVVLTPDRDLDPDLIAGLKRRIKEEASPRHVPWEIRQAPDVPRTISGKIVEIAVRNVLNGLPVDNTDALANPEALDHFRDLVFDLK